MFYNSHVSVGKFITFPGQGHRLVGEIRQQMNCQWRAANAGPVTLGLMNTSVLIDSFHANNSLKIVCPFSVVFAFLQNLFCILKLYILKSSYIPSSTSYVALLFYTLILIHLEFMYSMT